MCYQPRFESLPGCNSRNNHRFRTHKTEIPDDLGVSIINSTCKVFSNYSQMPSDNYMIYDFLTALCGRITKVTPVLSTKLYFCTTKLLNQEFHIDWLALFMFSYIKVKLLIHSQTSTMQPLVFGNGYIIASHTLLNMWFPILAGISVNLCW